MNKLIERLVALTMTQVLMASAGIGGLYYWAFYDDGAKLETQINTLVTEKNAQELKKKDTDKTLKEEKRIKELVGSLGLQFTEISKKLPNQLSKIDMSRQVAIFSQNARVKVKDKQLLDPVVKEIVDEVPVKVTIEDASFGEIALFVYQTAISERLVRVRDFVITPGANRLRFDGTVVGYRLNAEDPKKPGVKK